MLKQNRLPLDSFTHLFENFRKAIAFLNQILLFLYEQTEAEALRGVQRVPDPGQDFWGPELFKKICLPEATFKPHALFPLYVLMKTLPSFDSAIPFHH